MTNGRPALPTKSPHKSRRKAVRYTSRNRKAILTLKQLLRPNIYIHIKVINISSIGARIASKYTLSTKAKIKLTIQTKDGITWKVPAKVISSYSNTEYGIIFDTIQHDLMDKIIKYETDFFIM